MPDTDVQAIIRKAMQDDVFRLSLQRNLEKTLQDHNLQVDADELNALKGVDWGSTLNPALARAGRWIHISSREAAALRDPTSRGGPVG